MEKRPVLQKLVSSPGFRPLEAGRLRWRMDAADLPFETTEQANPPLFSFCQPRAEKTLKLGLSMNRSGHIFVCGSTGTARRSLIEAALARYGRVSSPLFDYLSACLPSPLPRPCLIHLSAGMGHAFQQDMEKHIEACGEILQENLPGQTPHPKLPSDPKTTKKRMEKAAARLEALHGELEKKYSDTHAAYYLKALKESLNESVTKTMSTVAAVGRDPLSEPDIQKALDAIFRFTAGRPQLVRDAAGTDVPLIFEPHPTPWNLFGYYVRQPGASAAGSVLYQPGSILKAQGGILFFDFQDVAREPDTWKHLKRCLKNHQIEPPFPELNRGSSLPFQKPEPIPNHVKLVVWGDENLYQELYESDADFRRIFRVRADLDSLMDRNEENIEQYIAFLKTFCLKEALPSFHRSGAAAFIEVGAELAGKQTKLITHWEELSEVIREASHWAMDEESTTVQKGHVERAMEEQTLRKSLPEEQLREIIREGSILLQTEGATVGQANGIALYETEDHVFGRPCRITAQTGIGRSGIINIEREANLSGKIHDKGVLILCGFLRDRYAKDKPLNLSASLCIEQFYSDVDGDSASLAEICALVSSLAQVPLFQGIAITGSISQRGEVQPVGCVNEKILGFFHVCFERGLTGNQGVIIPSANEKELMLPRKLIRYAEKGTFNIYSVRTVEETLEILTGREAGRADPEGVFPPGTLHRLVDDRLWELARGLRDFYGELDE